jgi:hypothetical protein
MRQLSAFGRQCPGSASVHCPVEIGVDGVTAGRLDFSTRCLLVAHRDLASRIHGRNAPESGQTRTDGNDPTRTWAGEGVVFDQLAEVGGQTGKHHAAQVGKPSPYL